MVDEVRALVAFDSSLGEPLVAGLPYLAAEAVYAIRHEMATTLDDVLLRRTRAHLLDRSASLAAAPAVARIMAAELGWDDATTAAQIDQYRALCAAEETAGDDPPTTHHDRPATPMSPTPPIEFGASSADVVFALRRRGHRDPRRLPRRAPQHLRGGRRRGSRSPNRAATGGRSRSTGRSPVRFRSWPMWSFDPATTEQVAAVARACNIARVPLTVAGGRSGVCGAADPGVRRCGARHHGARRHRSRSTRSPVSSRCCAGTFGPDLERELQERARALGRPLPAEFRPGHRRRLGRVPRRRAVLHPLRQDRRHGHRPRGRSGRRHDHPHRWSPRGCRRSRPHPADPRLGGHARDHHQGVVANPSAAAARASGGLRVRVVRRRRGGLPIGDAQRRDAGRPAAVRRRGVGTRSGRRRQQLCAARARRGRRGDRRRDHGRRRGGEQRCGWNAGRRRARRGLARASQRHHRAAGADPQGLRGRHDGDRRTVVGARQPLRQRSGCAPGRADRPGGHLPPVAQLLRRRLPVLHVRRHSPARSGRSRRTSRCGTPASAPCSPAAATCRITTASDSTGRGSCPRRSAASHAVLQTIKSALDPNGILNPGKLGFTSAFGPVPWP